MLTVSLVANFRLGAVCKPTPGTRNPMSLKYESMSLKYEPSSQPGLTSLTFTGFPSGTEFVRATPGEAPNLLVLLLLLYSRYRS